MENGEEDTGHSDLVSAHMGIIYALPLMNTPSILTHDPPQPHRSETPSSASITYTALESSSNTKIFTFLLSCKTHFLPQVLVFLECICLSAEGLFNLP